MRPQSRGVRSADRAVTPPPRPRLRLEALEDRLTPTNPPLSRFFFVTTTDNAGPGSLRQAIYKANANPGSDFIQFEIPGAGIHTIKLLSALPAITDPVNIAGQSQPGYAETPLIELTRADGSSVLHGLVIEAGGSGSQVGGLVINRFVNNGIRIQADNCVVMRCFIGTDATGTVAQGNRIGVRIGDGASGNVIGFITPATHNVISGNSTGVLITGAGTTGNVVMGNLIGTDATGNAVLGNTGDGVVIDLGASDNVVGWPADFGRNVISGNLHGVAIAGGGSGNRVEGNFIGTNADGTAELGNTFGVFIVSASNNVVGGTVAATRNLISGNSTGVRITEGTTGNRVEGNFIGTNFSGKAKLGNGVGVSIRRGASDNAIGGTAAEARNVISGNDGCGVEFSGLGTMGNRVQGNFIGTDATGDVALGNTGSGVLFDVFFGGAGRNFIGGPTPGAGNVISGNGGCGVEITGAGTIANRVQGNRIGLAATSDAAVENTLDGVRIADNAGADVVGGTQPGTGNVIAHNGGNGVVVQSGFAHAVLGNAIFDNGGLGIDLGADGVTLNDPDDADTGPNLLSNFPDLAVARITATGLRVSGSINTNSAEVRIEFFASPAADPTGYGEGARFLGAISLRLFGEHTVNFTVLLDAPGVDAGQVITATATGDTGSTSEFSLARTVT